MTNDDLIWLAGLLEGEGSFDLHRGRYPRVRLAMADRDVVGRAATLIGSRVRLTAREAPFLPIWHAEVSGTKAAEVMAAILPHMGARRSAKIAQVLAHGGYAVPRGMTRPPGLPLARVSSEPLPAHS